MKRLLFGAGILWAFFALAACGGGAETTQNQGGDGGTGGLGGSGAGTSSGSTSTTAAQGGMGGQGGDGGQGASVSDIAEQLAAVPGVVGINEESSDIAGWRYFLIDFDQPVDHENPGGQHFTQRLALHHRDASAPLVLASTGYYLFLPYQYLSEPAEMLDANQIFVEHRYFSPSRPDPADWTFLNIAQAAADHHAISEAFHTIYKAPWISTGASKGGMTSVYHRRFYPDDVQGTVAYVAPHSAGLDDARYPDFLNNVGTAACRKALSDLQREVLVRRDAMLTRMEMQAASFGLSYDIYGLEPSFESSAISFPFAFWQYQDASLCGSVPNISASDDEIWSFFDNVALTVYSTDDYFLGFEPYYWQAYSQLGTPGIDTSNIDDVLLVDFTMVDDLPSVDISPTFDAAAMPDITNWLSTEGAHILFVYGQNDPWSAAQFDITGATDTFKLFVVGGNHGADIASLSPADQATATSALATWAGVGPKILPPQKKIRPLPPMSLPRLRRSM